VGGSLRVGACQTPEILGDTELAVEWIADFAAEADGHGVDLLLFPEGFLQGYLVTEQHMGEHALDLTGAAFASILRRTKHIEQTLVFGVIERDGSRYFNTAVVTRAGELVGAFRKTHLTPGECLFHAGESYPTFPLRGVRFGINICYDTRFVEPAARVAAQGASLLLVPAQNMMRRGAATAWKDRHNSIRIQRVRETRMWLVSADVTGQRDEHRVAYGPTCIIDPQGEVIAQVPLMETGMVVADIS
jgi:predicted amidohydrolase